MVVASSRRHAVLYKEAFDAYLKEQRYTDVKCLVGFSGTVVDPDTGKDYTEGSMNEDGINGNRIQEAFATDEYRILLVANKFQTGFDQPLLHTMYVDKRLAGVQAVQTLSRLNRIAPGKDDTFVLDFVNEQEEILASFAPYYEAAGIEERVDPHRLYELQHELDGAGLYHLADVVQQQASANTFENFSISPDVKGAATDAMVEHLDKHGELVDKFLGDEIFGREASAMIMKVVYERLRKAG